MAYQPAFILRNVLVATGATVLSLAGLISATSFAQTPSQTNAQTRAAVSVQVFPDHVVQVVVPYPPAGLTDNIARYFAAKLKDIWNQPVVVENKPGASATLGASIVARATPDGYTMMVGSVGMATNPLMFKELPYKASDLTPLALVGLAPNVLYVNNSLPVKTVKELVEYAKKNPGKVTFASTGFGSSPHLAGELFASSAGVQLLHIPYKGTSAALADFLGGQVNIFFDTMQSMRYVQEGKIRALGVTTEQRLADTPDLATIEESGVAPGVISSSWFGYFIQTAVPEARRKQIADALLKVANEKETQEKLKSFGLIPVALDPVAYQKFLDAETKRWGAVIKAQNIKVD